MMSCFFFLVVLLVQSWPARPQQPPQDKNVFILAGQSNMAGRGGVVNNTVKGATVWDGFVPPKCRPNPSIMRLNAHLRWVEAREPLHQDIDVKHRNGIGPGMPFANTVMAKQPSFGVVGLVPCAVGGTNISQWERGKPLYNEMMKRATASLRDGGNMRALLWYQGEADTLNLKDAQSYERRLVKFFSDVRDDLQSPMLPIVQVFFLSSSIALVFLFLIKIVNYLGSCLSIIKD